MPSLAGIFYICDYLEITPSEFFDLENQNPAQLQELISNLKQLDDDLLYHMSEIVRKLAE